MYKNQNLRTIEKLENFLKAYVELEHEWGELNELESVGLYPFGRYFMEMRPEVSEWVHESIEELTEIEKDTILDEAKRIGESSYQFQLAFLDENKYPVSSQLAKSGEYITKVWEDYKTMTSDEATRNFGGESKIKYMILGDKIANQVIEEYEFKESITHH